MTDKRHYMLQSLNTKMFLIKALKAANLKEETGRQDWA